MDVVARDIPTTECKVTFFEHLILSSPILSSSSINRNGAMLMKTNYPICLKTIKLTKITMYRYSEWMLMKYCRWNLKSLCYIWNSGQRDYINTDYFRILFFIFRYHYTKRYISLNKRTAIATFAVSTYSALHFSTQRTGMTHFMVVIPVTSCDILSFLNALNLQCVTNIWTHTFWAYSGLA